MHKDTNSLLNECDLGIKMASGIFDEIIDEISDCSLHKIVKQNKEEHEKLQIEIEKLLNGHDNEPSMLSKTMSWMETNMKLFVDDTDSRIAEILFDGCSMGIKNLSKYLNKYKYADESSKVLTKQLIQLEDDLMLDVRKYL